MENTQKKGILCKAVGYGVNTTKSIFGYNAVKDGALYIAEMAKKTLSPSEIKKNAKVETFQQAKARLGVNDEDLIVNHNNFVITFYVSLFFAVVCLGFFINYAFFEKTILASMSSLSIMGACLANSFKYSFRAFQIKHQNLCSVKHYFGHKEFIPTYMSK